jgi:hypothetical protein
LDWACDDLDKPTGDAAQAIIRDVRALADEAAVRLIGALVALPHSVACEVLAAVILATDDLREERGLELLGEWRPTVAAVRASWRALDPALDVKPRRRLEAAA